MRAAIQAVEGARLNRYLANTAVRDRRHAGRTQPRVIRVEEDVVDRDFPRMKLLDETWGCRWHSATQSSAPRATRVRRLCQAFVKSFRRSRSRPRSVLRYRGVVPSANQRPYGRL